MPDGFDVRPEQLRHAATDLRADADGLDDAALGLRVAINQVSEAAGPGPLPGAASELASRFDGALRATLASLTDCASALEAASTQYLVGDAHVASTLIGGDRAAQVRRESSGPARWHGSRTP